MKKLLKLIGILLGAVSALFAGMTSTVSPLTRNASRVSDRSLRL